MVVKNKIKFFFTFDFYIRAQYSCVQFSRRIGISGRAKKKSNWDILVCVYSFIWKRLKFFSINRLICSIWLNLCKVNHSIFHVPEGWCDDANGRVPKSLNDTNRWVQPPPQPNDFSNRHCRVKSHGKLIHSECSCSRDGLSKRRAFGKTHGNDIVVTKLLITLLNDIETCLMNMNKWNVPPLPQYGLALRDKHEIVFETFRDPNNTHVCGVW